jgi:hypothetical protein
LPKLLARIRLTWTFEVDFWRESNGGLFDFLQKFTLTDIPKTGTWKVAAEMGRDAVIQPERAQSLLLKKIGHSAV